MRPEKFDVIVIGAGVVGMSTTYHLAGEGRKVLLLEQFELLHDRGQSYGESRQVSVAHDTRERVELDLQSLAGWHKLERVSGEKVFLQTGGIDLVTDEKEWSAVLKNRDVMWSFGLDYEEWGHRALSDRGWRVPENACALYSPRDGILNPTSAVHTLLWQARYRGADIRHEEPVMKIFADGSQAKVITTKSVYTAKNLVIACGAWTNKVLANLNFSLPIQTVGAQTVYFQPKANASTFSVKGKFPTWYHHRNPLVYGFPIVGKPGIKIGFHQDGNVVDMDQFDRTPRFSAIQGLREYLEQYLPDAAGLPFGAWTCLYDNTPDRKPFVDQLRESPNCFVGAGFSGNGFGPAIAIGQALADLALRGRTEIEISQFKISRFANQSA